MTDSTQHRARPDQAAETCVTSELLARIRADYQKLPGLCLTSAQAARLWSLTPGVCARVLEALVAEGALICTRDVRYVAAAVDRARRTRGPRTGTPRRGA